MRFGLNRSHALVGFCAFLLTVGGAVSAQENIPETESIEIVETVSAFGQPMVQVQGLLHNTREDAFTDISVRATAFDADDQQIGEGFGVAVNACGAGWLPGYTLQPDATSRFDVPLEFFETDDVLEYVMLFVTATAVDPSPEVEPQIGFRQITDSEVIEVEWTGNTSLRYASGCEQDQFNTWDWVLYNAQTNTQTRTTHPFADEINEQLLTRLQSLEPAEAEHAFIRFAPDGDRLIFQDRINNFLSAALDGRFQRQIHIGLHNRTLQGVYWQPEERFLAYYFGGYGDPVYYFTANAEARRISPSPATTRPSIIVPGITRDANRAVIAGDFNDEGLGYYIAVFNNNFFEKLFDATPPGNNYPSPLPLTDPETDLVSVIYLAMDDEEGNPRLMCFNREENELHDLAPLPMSITQDERAQWWLSPDEESIALAANGVNGGLWWIDLTALPACLG